MSSSSSSASSSSLTTMDNEKLQQFMGKILSDFGGAASSILVYIGDKLGLYRAMSDFGKPITSQELANLTGTSERYIREWLANQAAGGYLTYDPLSQRFTLPFEHAQVLANESSPVNAVGGFQIMMSLYRDEAKILEAFKTGKGIAWGDHDKDLFEGTGKFGRLLYTANLVSSWIPALDNGKVEQRLKQGGLKVADIGCGHGVSTTLMTKAYPNSKLYGFDNQLYILLPALWHSFYRICKKKAREEGLGEDRIIFEVALSTNFPFPTEGSGIRVSSSNNEQ